MDPKTVVFKKVNLFHVELFLMLVVLIMVPSCGWYLLPEKSKTTDHDRYSTPFTSGYSDPIILENEHELIYVRSYPAGAKCVLQNNSQSSDLITPSYLNPKVDGDLKITCTYDNKVKTCISKTYKNFHEDYSNPLSYAVKETFGTIFNFGKTPDLVMHYYAPEVYHKTACIDFNINSNDDICDDDIDNGVARTEVTQLRKQSQCTTPLPRVLP